MSLDYETVSDFTSIFTVNELHYIGFDGWKVSPWMEEPEGMSGATKEFQLVELK